MPVSTTKSAADWIDILGLQPHPEGGYFRETYRDARQVDIDGRRRGASTAIYFLLERGQFSALHRIRSDEVWHFYAGASILVSAIMPGGSVDTWRLGIDVDAGDLPQCVVPARAWFGAELAGDGDYALVGCTVAPGFDFDDFEMGVRADLIASYPEHARMIERLTRDG